MYSRSNYRENPCAGDQDAGIKEKNFDNHADVEIIQAIGVSDTAFLEQIERWVRSLRDTNKAGLPSVFRVDEDPKNNLKPIKTEAY